MSSDGAVTGVVSYLPAFEAGVVSGSGGCLGDAVSSASSLTSPLVRGSGAAEVHWYWSVVKGRGCRRGIYGRSPISDGVPVGGSVWWGPSPHILLGALEKLLRQLSSLWRRASPISGIGSSCVGLVAEHTLDNLAGPRGVDRLLFHLFVASRERGFHYLRSDGAGESSKEEVSTLIVSCGILCESEQLLERGDVCVDVGPFHPVVVEGGSGPLLL